MTNERARQLLILVREYQTDYGKDDEEIANGNIKLHAVVQDLEESME